MTAIGYIGKQTIALNAPPSILANACGVGKKEGEGPLRDSFDFVSGDSFFGEKTWEKAESAMLSRVFALALEKAKKAPSDVRYVFAGDLLNQCTGSAFGLRGTDIPFFGLYGACSTMAESLALASMTVSAGYAPFAAAVTSSHFCSAERQFRTPLEYGGQRTPTAQWTVTGSGAVILAADGPGPYVTHVTPGRIVDPGITDANNMGAAMAPENDRIGPYQGNRGAPDSGIYTQNCTLHSPLRVLRCYEAILPVGNTVRASVTNSLSTVLKRPRLLSARRRTN